MKQVGNYVYDVDDKIDVRIWEKAVYDDGGSPFLYQPSYPDNTEFESVEAASAWAEAQIALISEAPVTE